ncbi:MAG: RNA polymerase sigma factor [Thermoguttaceae bacterium]|nr:RNA polymerase sigma factor [Thermoguttaceae bacterium]
MTITNDSHNTSPQAPVEKVSTGVGEASSVAYVLPNGNIDWSAALKANENWMRGVIAQRVGDREGVDEVFQEIGLAAARQRTPLRDPTKVGSWLYRLAVVQSSLYRRSLGRRRKARQRYEEHLRASESDEAQQEPLEWLLDRERKEHVRVATSRIPDDEQKILRMKYADNKSYQEIADELGTTVFAVQSKLHRARAKLKRTLLTLV